MRWQAEIVYRTDAGENIVDHFVDELDEIADIVERGPDWNTIVAINISLVHVTTPGLTVERAEQC